MISRQHPCPSLRQRCLARAQQGFTLIELIIVLVLTGVLAVFAAPRILNNSDFYARGFHDENMALLRYAQKTAISQRRTVCVTFAVTPESSASLRIASQAAVGTCDTDLVGPRGDTPGTVSSKSGVSYSAPPTAVSFDGLGQPLSSAGAVLTAPSTITVTGSGKIITIAAATGYVYD